MLKFIQTGKGLLVSIFIVAPSIYFGIGEYGLFGTILLDNPVLYIAIYSFIITHLTITAMSLSFHRYHTHKGVIINKYLDTIFQTQLWIITSLSMIDWVAVHKYHHIHSDKDLDPHSPVKKGFWHVFFKGALDFNDAKYSEPVQKIRKHIKLNRYEKFIAENSMFGPYVLTALILVLFGPIYGTIICLLNYVTSPLFAIGGVNALAHWWGYKNHKSGDNSRNIGFLFPLNFLTCGELDHNNHHGNQKSCSFRHKWYEFDIGYVYIKILEKLKLATIKSAYTPVHMKQDISRQFEKMLENNRDIKDKCIALAKELNMTLEELVAKVKAYIEGKRSKLEQPLLNLKKEILVLVKEQYHFEIA